MAKSKITLNMIKELDNVQKSLSFELTAAVGMYAGNSDNSIEDRAAALRIVCQYMPRKQGKMTDEEFVNSFLNGEEYKG